MNRPTEESQGRREGAFQRHMANLHALRLMKERVVLGRLESLIARAPDAAAERVLANIANEATFQRDELEEVLLAWRRAIARGAAPRQPRALKEAFGFADLVQSFIRVKEQGAGMYEAAARDCPEPDLAARLRELARQDREHALILEELLGRG